MRRTAILGFLIWAGATVALRLDGENLIRGSVWLLLGVSLLLMIAITLLVLRRYRGREERALAAIGLVAPGMLLDTFTTIWFPVVFPNMHRDIAGPFAGLLLFCYVVVLLTAVLYVPRDRSRA